MPKQYEKSYRTRCSYIEVPEDEREDGPWWRWFYATPFRDASELVMIMDLWWGHDVYVNPWPMGWPSVPINAKPREPSRQKELF